MKRKIDLPDPLFRGLAIRASTLLLAAFLGACSITPSVVKAPTVVMPATVSEEGSAVAVLNYYQTLQRMTPAQINRERSFLAALPATPNTQVRMAMILGHSRGQQDFTKALSLLEAVLKSSEADAVSLHPLARLLAENFGERQKLEGQVEKQSQQLKESQRKTAELQEKIDELADIERTLPQRPRARRPAGVAR
ncbi:MAG: permease [Azonexus sp.]